MRNEKIIVFTTHGHSKTIDRISVSLFDTADGYGQDRLAHVEHFCDNINRLKLKDDAWVYARTANQNIEYAFSELLPSPKLDDLILHIDDRAVQKVLREVDTRQLECALKSCSEEMREKIYRNCSKRGAAMLKDNVQCMGVVRLAEMEEAQHKIISIIQRLADVGEIVINADGGFAE
jgi:hypothetical protein